MKFTKRATAEVFLSLGQNIGLAVIAALAIAAAVLWGPGILPRIASGIVVVFYLCFVLLKLVTFGAGAFYRPAKIMPASMSDPNLPSYSVLVPMYKETAEGFEKLLKSLDGLEYPKQLLQVLLILEEKDETTIAMVRSFQLPFHIEPVIVPNCGPTTKPKACDYAMLKVTGDRLVIFDFEDRPERLHLLKAVAAMDAEHACDPRVVCVQGQLMFWNPRKGAAPFYFAEYVVHFRWMLAGLARLGLVTPLGGTSNHFLTSALRKVASVYPELMFRHNGSDVRMPNVWDPFNVTEDADLGARLARLDMLVKMCNALTLEEAPHSFKTALNQRSRWLKGYAQTALVQMRRFGQSIRQMGLVRYIVFNLFVGGTPVSLLLNPLVWGTTVLYIAARINHWQGTADYIESLFPGPLYYIAMTVAIGNVVFFFQMLAAVLHQQENDAAEVPQPVREAQYGLVLPLVATPWWWLFTALPATKAMFELSVPGLRSHWSKTMHGGSVGQETAMLEGAAQALPPGQLRVDPTLQQRHRDEV